MGKRGPAPKPAELAKADGTYRPERHGETVVLGERGIPDPPETLTDAQHDAWCDIVDPVADAGMLQASDAVALEAAAVALATFREADELVREQGLLVLGRFNTDVANPAIAIRTAASKELVTILSRFGMTPSDRVSLGLGVIKGRTAQAEWDEALGRKGEGDATD